MDYRNSSELYRESCLDLKEGADMIMVKPGSMYLDIIIKLKMILRYLLWLIKSPVNIV